METLINHNNRNYLLDTKKEQITFYRTENGLFIPSVTTVLDAYPKGAAYFQWIKSVGEDADEIRDDAGRRGSRVHALTERYDAGDEIRLVDDFGNINMKLNEWAMLERYVEFRNKYPFEISMTEQTIISESLGVAGTLDRVITLPSGEKMLFDIKTSYKEMLRSIGVEVDSVAILWLNAKTRTDGKDGKIQGIGWQLVTKTDTKKDWKLFQATQELWRAENEDLKPRMNSYKLSYQLQTI